MSFNDTLDRFKLASGLSDLEAGKWLSLINESRAYVSSLCDKNNLTEFQQTRLDIASGVYAYYKYCVYTMDEEKSFSVGDVSIASNTDKVSNAKKIWNEELNELSDIISSVDFAFMAVT